MPTIEAKDPSIDANAVLKSKRVLVINPGTPKKRFILQKLKSLGLDLVILNKENNWAARCADAFLTAYPHYHLQSAMASL